MKFYIDTLGCKVNTYETNVMIDLLTNHGYIEVAQLEQADIYILNTCTVTNTADHKSCKLLRRAKKILPNGIIIAVGCLVQVNRELLEEMEGISILIGNKNKTKIVDMIEQFLKERKRIVDVTDILNNTPFESMQLNNFNRTRAFVKIQDGCNNFCSYCIIPYSRGNVRSKKREDVIFEVQTLVSLGHKEIVLTGIHTGNYGAEFEHYHFSSLLEDLVKIKGLKRIRISSIEITELDSHFLTLLKEHEILVDHMHIPLQSGSDYILKQMNRKYDKTYFMTKVKEIRSVRPDISITTDVIVGFPGETEVEFLESIDTIRTIGFTKVHVFPYSRRKGTVADTLDCQVSDCEKKKRSLELLALSKTLEKQYMEKFIGKTLDVIPEVYQDGMLIGHTGNYLLVHVKGCKKMLHQVISVTITEIGEHWVEAIIKETCGSMS